MSNQCRYRFASSGEITPPCGVPFCGRLPSALRPSLSGGSTTGALQPHPDQLQHRPVHDPHAQARHQLVVRNRIEVALQVRVVHRLIPGLQVTAYLLQRLVRRAPRTEPVGAIQEIRLEDRLQDQQGRHLHHPVAHRRDAQRSQLPIRLRDVDAPHRLRPVGLGCAAIPGSLPETAATPLADASICSIVTPSTPGAPLLARTRVPRRLQHVAPIDPVVQRVEPELRFLLGLLAQLLSQLRNFLRQARLLLPLPAPLRWLCRSSVVGFSSKRLSPPLTEACFSARPLRSTGVTRFPATMGLSDSRPEPLPGLCIPAGRWRRLPPPPRRVSQVPRLICPRALSPTTPEGPATALPVASPPVSGFITLWQTGHLQFCVTRPNRVRLRYGFPLSKGGSATPQGGCPENWGKRDLSASEYRIVPPSSRGFQAFQDNPHAFSVAPFSKGESPSLIP